MSTVTKTMSDSQIASLYQKLKPLAKSESKPQYTRWMIKTSDMTVTAYTSGKVVFQGKDVDWLADEPKTAPASRTKKDSRGPSPKAGSTFPQAGSDEVGTGDYIGPVVVAATIVENEETARKLKSMGVGDSKAMTDEAILKIGPELKAMLPHSIIYLDNERYNKVYDPAAMNLNKIKAWMHNQVYLNLQTKGYTLPALCVVDQFCQPSAYYRYLQGQKDVVGTLTFQTKAESAYPAVAAASVLARYTFLKVWESLEKEAGIPLQKGGGPKATQSAQQLLARFGQEGLAHYVKLHFANTSLLK